MLAVMLLSSGGWYVTVIMNEIEQSLEQATNFLVKI